MGLRFRRSFKMFPGVRLNVSRGGISASFGVRGATVNVGKHGVRGTAGIPGTGLSYSTLLAPTPSRTPSRQPIPQSQSPVWWTPVPQGAPQPINPVGNGPSPYVIFPDPSMHMIASAAVEQLTSGTLEQFRQMIIDARRQQVQIEADLRETTAHGARLRKELAWKQWFFLKYLFAKRILQLGSEIESADADVVFFREWLQATQVTVDFDVSPDAQRAYGQLVQAYDQLRQSIRAWDVTADRRANRVVERTTADRIVDRRPIRPDYAASDFVQFPGRALRLPNAINEDLLIYPGMILMERKDGVFALIDIRQVTLRFGATQFIETEGVPPDSRVVGETLGQGKQGRFTRSALQQQLSHPRVPVRGFTLR